MENSRSQQRGNGGSRGKPWRGRGRRGRGGGGYRGGSRYRPRDSRDRGYEGESDPRQPRGYYNRDRNSDYNRDRNSDYNRDRNPERNYSGGNRYSRGGWASRRNDNRRTERKGSYKDSQGSDEEYDRNASRWLKKKNPGPTSGGAKSNSERRVESGVERVAVGKPASATPAASTRTERGAYKPPSARAQPARPKEGRDTAEAGIDIEYTDPTSTAAEALANVSIDYSDPVKSQAADESQPAQVRAGTREIKEASDTRKTTGAKANGIVESPAPVRESKVLPKEPSKPTRKKLAAGTRNKNEEERLFGVKKTGINFDKYDDVPVSCTGKSVPKPVLNFDEAGLHELLLSNVKLAGFSKPTPVQKFSIPICRKNRDLMACAQTGSGKTGGFLFPILHKMLEDSEDALNNGSSSSSHRNYDNHRRRRGVYPECLILSPTRELAIQIHNESKKFCYRTPLKTVCVYGGEDIYRQVMQMERGCHICIATPGRLVDLINRRRVSMSRIRYLCFDEADRMLDMGFEPQIRHIIQDSDMPGKEKRQTLMFSATFPKQIQSLAQDFLEDYIFLSVGRVGATCSLVTQKVHYAEDGNKKEALMRVLPDCKGLTLIFVERKRSADLLTEWLYGMGVEAVSIHGDRSQDERKMALDMFKTGRCPILVATDVAARGLDIDNVTDVINYDMPSSIDTYVHRIGRTGRCGNSGTSITFVNERNRNVLHDLFHSLRENKQETPDWFIKLYRSAGTLRSSYRANGRFGGNDVRQQDQNGDLGNAQTGLGRNNAIKPKPAQATDDGWSDDDDPKDDAADAGGDGWDSD
mmetsp:Transcript_11845/g.21637  ORF Transcript_11845/g.21637 Transcript_11845/m.21637 type:complete len:810 (-) Transcript_11845:301-2730(-)